MEAKAWACSGTKWQLETSRHFSLLQRRVVMGLLTGGWIWISLRELMWKVADNEGSESQWHFCHWHSSEKDGAFNYRGFQLHKLLVQHLVKSLYGIGPPCGWAYFQDKILRIDETWIKTAFGEDALQEHLAKKKLKFVNGQREHWLCSLWDSHHKLVWLVTATSWSNKT